MIRKSLISIVISCIPLAAMAQNWVKFSETPELEFYIDQSSIKKNGSTVTYWTMHNKKMAALLTNPSSSYSTKYRVTENCDSEESRITYYASYEKSMGQGKVIESQTWDGKLNPNIPGSIGYMVMQYVCNSKRSTK